MLISSFNLMPLRFSSNNSDGIITNLSSEKSGIERSESSIQGSGEVSDPSKKQPYDRNKYYGLVRSKYAPKKGDPPDLYFM